MKTSELEKLFEKYEDEYTKFEKVENKLSNRPDLHAFILIDKLCPGKNQQDIISASNHDEIWISVEPKQLARNATEEQILELIRCGLRYSDDSFCMFT